MNYLTFKEHLALFEARQPGVKYTEKQVKNVVDKVTATLSGTDSASMTKLAKRYARLEVSMKAMKEKHDELNARLKGDVQGYFDAEDVVLTRVVETAQFTLTMAKEIKKAEGTTEVDYKSIIAALEILIPDELQSKIEMITAKYTKVIPPKDPIKRLTVSKEVISEGFWDTLKDKAAAFLKSMTSWATRYDAKLEALKRKLKPQINEMRTGKDQYANAELKWVDGHGTILVIVSHDNFRAFRVSPGTEPANLKDTRIFMEKSGMGKDAAAAFKMAITNGYEDDGEAGALAAANKITKTRNWSLWTDADQEKFIPSKKKVSEAVENPFQGFEYEVHFDEKAQNGNSSSYAARAPYVVYQGGNPGDDLKHKAYGRFRTDKEAKAEAKRLQDQDKRNGVTKRKVTRVKEGTIAYYDEKARTRKDKLTIKKLVNMLSDSSLPQATVNKIAASSTHITGEVTLPDLKDILRLAKVSNDDKQEVMDILGF